MATHRTSGYNGTASVYTGRPPTIDHRRNQKPVQLEIPSALGHSDEYKRTRARLLKLAKDMLQVDANSAAESSPTHGVRFDQVRHAAEHRGWLSGREGTKDGDPSMARLLSFGAQIMREADGVACEYTPSRHMNAKCRPVRVYRLASAVRG